MNESIAIRTDDLSKNFGRGRKRIQAVKKLNLEVRAGQVYGFLGPNGAGKTTTIRMVMNLIRPDRGEVKLFGCPVRQRLGVLRRVGAIVERASFYDFLSARKNLDVLARTGGLSSVNGTARRITMLLEQVGLAGREDQRVGGYSTGMKQRLGLAEQPASPGTGPFHAHLQRSKPHVLDQRRVTDGDAFWPGERQPRFLTGSVGHMGVGAARDGCGTVPATGHRHVKRGAYSVGGGVWRWAWV